LCIAEDITAMDLDLFHDSPADITSTENVSSHRVAAVKVSDRCSTMIHLDRYEDSDWPKV